MKIDSIREHLRPYSILGRRQTTINHAFASAIAQRDDYDPARMAQAIKDLGQDPELDLKCVYCGKPAETWDHAFGLVKNKRYSGYGHTLGNLVPCCKACNSRKGNMNWNQFLESAMSGRRKVAAKTALNKYFGKYLPPRIDHDEIRQICPAEIKQLDALQARVLSLLKDADNISGKVRYKLNAHVKSHRKSKTH